MPRGQTFGRPAGSARTRTLSATARSLTSKSNYYGGEVALVDPDEVGAPDPPWLSLRATLPEESGRFHPRGCKCLQRHSVAVVDHLELAHRAVLGWKPV